ncbi:MAG: tripartite tricarboxylate transporter substrate-binding protein [Pirellulales bacterium]
MSRRLLFLLLTIVGVGIPCGGCRDKSDFPNRPIKLVCPWSPGGGTDTVSREVAALLEDELKIPVNVINATGGSGVTGHTRGARAKPDGYTLTMITVELNMLRWRGLTNIGYQDFDPLILVNRDASALFVRTDAPWQSLADLEREIRAKPRGLKASGTAQGGIWHVAVAGWLDFVGLKADDVIWVSINGAGPSLQELISGGVDFICCSLPEAATLMETGRIRSLGVMAPQRVATYSEVPTFREQGVDWSMGGWRGLALPNGVPADRKEILLAALKRVIARDEYREFMSTSGFDARGDGPQEFAAALARHDDEFQAILTSDTYESVRRSRYGAMVFPAVIGGFLLAVATVLYVRRSGEAANEMDLQGAIVAVGLAIAWVLVFVAVMDWLGFILTATVLLVLLMKYLGTRLWTAAVISALVSVTTYQVFAVHLRVSLPWGLWGW